MSLERRILSSLIQIEKRKITKVLVQLQLAVKVIVRLECVGPLTFPAESGKFLPVCETSITHCPLKNSFILCCSTGIG